MDFLRDIAIFFQERTWQEIFVFFWYFILFDFTRYVLMDIIFIPYCLWQRRRLRPAKLRARRRLLRERPLVSILVPGKNEGKHLPRLAASLQEQTYSNFELIVVDDGSDDDTPAICRRLQRQGLIDKFFRNDQRGGKASAANLALRYAAGSYIVHLDADSHLRPDSIEQILIPFFLDDRIGAVGGDIRVHNVTESLATTLQAIDYMKSISTGRVIYATLGILRIVSGAYGAFRTDILRRLGGWDVGPGLDGDIALRIRKLGFRIAHELDAVCYTNVPNTFFKLARQRYRWDRSLVRFRIRKHRDMLSARNKNFDVLNFLTVADNILFNLILNLKWWVYAIQIIFINHEFMHIIISINYAIYLVVNVIEFFLALLLFGNTMRRADKTLFFFLPLVPLYVGLYLRLIRTFAHFMEFFFKVSYYDSWNPWKVSRVTDEGPRTTAVGPMFKQRRDWQRGGRRELRRP